MTTPFSFLPLAIEFNGTPPDIQPHVQASDSASILSSSRSQFQDGPGQHLSHSLFHIPNDHYSDPYFPDTDVYSAPFDQATLDPVSTDEYPFTFLESDLSFVSNIPDSASTSLNLTHDDTPWTTSGPQYGPNLLLAQDFVVNNIPQISDEVPEYSIPSTFVASPTSYAVALGPQFPPSSQDMGTSFQTTDPYTFPSVDIDVLPPDWSSGQQVAHLLAENSSTRDLAGPAAGVYSSSYDSYPGEGLPVYHEAVPLVLNRYYAARPPIEQQSMLFERPVGSCQWEDENGKICGEVVTYGGLSGHLSKHGIKQKARDWPTKCHWLGCAKKRSMNRESILRHIREIHLGLKRTSKRVQSASQVPV